MRFPLVRVIGRCLLPLIAFVISVGGMPARAIQTSSPTASMISQLAVDLQEAGPQARERAAWALGCFRDAAAIEALLIAVNDPEPAVREQAYASLTAITQADFSSLPVAAEFGAPDGKRPADPVDDFTLMLADPDPGVRRVGALALGANGDPDAVESLIPLLADDAIAVRRSAADALGALQDPRALPALLAALSNPTRGISQEVAAALERIELARAQNTIPTIYLPPTEYPYDSSQL